MNFVVLSFKTATISAFLCNILVYFEDKLPSSLVRNIKFGRSAAGLGSDNVFLFEVPKRWFTHFYIFAFSFSSLTLLAYWNQVELLEYVFETITNSSLCIPNSTALLASVLMWIQVSRRLYECLYISKFSNVGKMNVLAYLVGLWHYFGAIISVFGGSGCSELSTFRILTCLPIFTFAWIKQLESHVILGNLRQGQSDHEYKIPFGGLYEYVSCPNYFCEILIYLSLSGLFGFQNSEFNWVTAWVVLNQIFSALLADRWYRKKFGDRYPSQRRLLIPFLL